MNDGGYLIPITAWDAIGEIIKEQINDGKIVKVALNMGYVNITTEGVCDLDDEECLTCGS